MKIFTPGYFLFAILTYPCSFVYSQLVVSSVGTPQQLTQNLFGGGVIISNVTLTAPGGSWGTFDGINSNIGLDSGIILTSGKIANAVGPNTSGSVGTLYYAPGDPDLTALSGSVTNDACVLEFDLQVTGDTLTFNYVFGSEEYPEFVDSYNDIFAFLISGPGITGEQNIAIVPGTTNPVSINNVNCQNNSPYYICNDPYDYLCPNSYNCPNNSNSTTVQYDGFTTVLTASIVLQPLQTYHLKLAIADAVDSGYDSGVFIEAGSLSSIVILPIELIEFTATINKNKEVELNWLTASEWNNDYFSVERSFDAIHFQPIGTIDGNGTTDQTHHYFFTDEHPHSGYNYYRLRQTDYDNHFTYSPIEAVKLSNDAEGYQLNIWPNPIHNTLNFQVLLPDYKNEIAEIRIYDEAGLLQGLMKLDENEISENPSTMSVHDLVAGNYLVQLLIDGHVVASEKIMVQ